MASKSTSTPNPDAKQREHAAAWLEEWLEEMSRIAVNGPLAAPSVKQK